MKLSETFRLVCLLYDQKGCFKTYVYPFLFKLKSMSNLHTFYIIALVCIFPLPVVSVNKCVELTINVLFRSVYAQRNSLLTWGNLYRLLKAVLSVMFEYTGYIINTH